MFSMEESLEAHGENPPTAKRIKLNEISTSEDVSNTDSCTFKRICPYPAYLHDFCDDVCRQFKYQSKLAVVFDDGKGTMAELSYGMLHHGANILKELLANLPLIHESKFVAVQCGVGVLYPMVILGILRSGKAFFNIDPDKWESSVEDGIRFLNLSYVISETKTSVLLEKGKDFTATKILDFDLADHPLKFSVYELKHYQSVFSCRTIPEDNFAYAIQTSGTTGKRKMVLVPHSCIRPNIYDFVQTVWKLTSHDVIFGSAPPTFDPHIVELFATLAVGATIFYTSVEVKLNVRLLTNLFARHCVTILQITPSLFRRISASLSQISAQLHLRIITFGGEACPTKEEIRLLMAGFQKIDINFQNVYGVTEVSCWASFSNIDMHSNTPVTIGEGLSETSVFVQTNDCTSEGEILIGSDSRSCVILDSNSVQQERDFKTDDSSKSTRFLHRSGDTGEIVEGGIIFKGRHDRVIKRNGMKIPLYEIEKIALSTGLVSYAEARLHNNKLYLLVNLNEDFCGIWDEQSTNTNFTLIPALSNKLDIPLFMYPDYIVAIKFVPLNANGKIDFDLIVSSVDKSSTLFKAFDVSESQLVKTLEPIWRSCTWPGKREFSELLNENFHDAGGDSISAARFVESTFMALKLFGTDVHQQYEQFVLENLIHGTFQCVINILLKIISFNSPISASFNNLKPRQLTESQEFLWHPLQNFERESNFEFKTDLMTETDNNFPIFNAVDPERVNNLSCKSIFPAELINMYDFNLGLCVDASPAVVNEGLGKDRIIVGCHGGVLICVDLSHLRRYPKNPQLALVWKVHLCNRIEASVTIDRNYLYGYVGCHNCNFYKFSILTGAIVGFVKCKAPIRSRAVVSNSTKLYCVIFVDSANSVYCVNPYNMNIIWVQGSLTFLATIVPEIYHNKVLVTTVNKGLVALSLQTGDELIIWETENFFYSSPTIIFGVNSPVEREAVILAGTLEANEEGLEARVLKTGDLLWCYKLPPTQPLQHVSQPIYNKCCDNIIWISTNRLIIANRLGRNFSSREIFNSRNKEKPSLCNNILYSFGSNPCIFFCKTNGKSKMRFMEMHGGGSESESNTIEPWFVPVNFESFSKPVQCSEFIIMGGRDNKLHVMKCSIKRNY